MGTGTGKTLVQMQAERLAQSMYADLMASGGVGYNQIAKEVLFFLPKDFLHAYEEMWHEGVAGKDDGGAGQRGASQAEVGRLGKAATRNIPGKIQISSGGAKRKSYKKYWVIADEEALELKDRVDKRLRGLAREIRSDLERIKRERRGDGEDGDRRDMERDGGSADASASVSDGRARCASCGRLIGSGWKFCSNCGYQIGQGHE